MKTRTLIQLSAAAAFTAGTLRVASTFVGPRLDADFAELLYLPIDIAFVFAIPGIYLTRHGELGAAGLGGFVLALCGAASIVGPDGTLLGVDMYQVGGALLLLGLGMLAAAQLRLGSRRRGSSLGWLGALVAMVAAAATAQSWLWALMGVLLGIGFIAAGRELWREAERYAKQI